MLRTLPDNERTLPDNERTYAIDGGGVSESMPTFWRRSRSGRMLSKVVEWSTFAFAGPIW